jgi:hypothetical protein
MRMIRRDKREALIATGNRSPLCTDAVLRVR